MLNLILFAKQKAIDKSMNFIRNMCIVEPRRVQVKASSKNKGKQTERKRNVCDLKKLLKKEKQISQE